MLYSRGTHPERVPVWEAAAKNAGYGFDFMASQYLSMSVLACAMLVPAMVGLASSAAVLGARSRERRLAVLRLMGLSGADVTRMSLLDALVQSAAGAVIGTAAYLVTLPAWSSLTVMGTRITASEMVLPLRFLAAVLVGSSRSARSRHGGGCARSGSPLWASHDEPTDRAPASGASSCSL